ncbi:hypothetical protein [Pseudomonas chlororaphis]|uniref:Uncharacterized protein n=1 Tax=Pseudomonas chlororaphis TaxID=587753 RepID=A0A1Q8EPV3_9PSED|nr:hypothetical protein [Pseudomonas chlororaphis]OLF53824.1 hypothetical protein BTN82_15265 [Pseudomonas chlororaphis]
MNLRTIPLRNHAGEHMNAALVCAFHVPACDRSFLLYSLNEKLGNRLARAYLGAFAMEENSVRMIGANTHEWDSALQVLKTLLDDVNTGRGTAGTDSYSLVDLSEKDVQTARVETHRQLQINQRWLLKLLHHAAGGQYEAPGEDDPGDAAESMAFGFEVLEEPPQATESLMSKLTTVSTDPALAVNFSFGERVRALPPTVERPLAPVQPAVTGEPDPFESLKKVEHNIQSLMTNLRQKKDVLLAERLRLSTLERQLTERETAMALRETAMQDKDALLRAGFSQLKDIDSELDELFRGLASNPGEKIRAG